MIVLVMFRFYKYCCNVPTKFRNGLKKNNFTSSFVTKQAGLVSTKLIT